MKNNGLPSYVIYILPIIGTALLTGCSTYLESQHISNIKTNESPTGILYSLPMLQYEIEITRKLISCTPDVEVRITVDVKEHFMPDPNTTFELDYTELAGIASTSEIEAEFYENGTIKSLNIEVDDRSAEILANTFKIASNVALTAVGVSPLPTVLPIKLPVCNQKSKDSVAAIQNSDKDLKRLTNNVENASKEVEGLSLIVAGADKPSEATLKSLQKAVEELKKHKKKLVDFNKVRAPYLAQLEYKEKLRWPKSTEGDVMEANFPPSAVLKDRWFKKDKKQTIGDKTINAKLTLHFGINQLVANIPSNLPEKPNKGVFYRYPMPIELEVCTDAPCNEQSRNVIKTIRSKAPQYGPLVLLPFENSAFQNNRLEVAFSTSGLPSKMTFKNQRSAAEAATGTVAGIAEQLPALRQQLLNADLEKLKRKTALLEQEKAFLDASQSIEPSQTADLDAQTALIKAQTDLVNAQIALEEAQRKQDE